MLMEEVASLYLVKRNDNIFKETYMLLSKRNSETWDDAC